MARSTFIPMGDFRLIFFIGVAREQKRYSENQTCCCVFVRDVTNKQHGNVKYCEKVKTQCWKPAVCQEELRLLRTDLKNVIKFNSLAAKPES